MKKYYFDPMMSPRQQAMLLKSDIVRERAEREAQKPQTKKKRPLIRFKKRR